MGYRDRKAIRAQQKQQALGGAFQNEQRVDIPVPSSMNLRDGTQLPPTDATYLLNAVGNDGGVRLMKERQLVGWLDNIRTLRETSCSLVSYQGSVSADAELWCLYYSSVSVSGSTNFISIANIGAMVDSGITATASHEITVFGNGVCDSIGEATAGSYIEFNKTIIYVNGANCHMAGMQWTKAAGWNGWSASVSAGDSNNHWGIYAFKNRIYTWMNATAQFAYGSVDQVKGMMHNYQLGAVLGQDLMFMTSMTRDGGSGPDDFAVFVGIEGRVAVYQGSNPADASDWGLVGVYQIGKPLSKNGWVQYGNQVLIACEDDVYVLPDDLQGTRQGTKVQRNTAGTGGTSYNRGWRYKHLLNAVRESNRGLIMFGDGTTLNTARGLEGSHTQLSSAEPYLVYETPQASADYGTRYANLAVYKDRIFALEPGHGYTPYAPNKIYEIDPSKGSKYSNNKVYFGELPSQGRANISLVNPVIRKTNNHVLSTTASTPSSLVYRVAAVYDDDLLINTSVDPELWQTASAAGGTFGDWLPLFGTGDNPQVALEVLSASTSAEFVFTKLKLTVSDTGGL